MRREREIQLEEARIAHHLRGVRTRKAGQPGGRRKHHCLIAGLIIAIVQWFLPRLWNNLRASIQKAHHRRNVKDVLIESAKEKHSVVPERTTQREAELLLR